MKTGFAWSDVRVSKLRRGVATAILIVLASGSQAGASELQVKLHWEEYISGAREEVPLYAKPMTMKVVKNVRNQGCEEFLWHFVLPPEALSPRTVVVEVRDGKEWSEWFRKSAQSWSSPELWASARFNTCYEDGTFWEGTETYRIRVLPEAGKPSVGVGRFKVKYLVQGARSSGSSGSSSGSRSGSTGSFLGWNLESVQDYLGYDPPTMDCSYRGRSVFWSSNWWVVGQSGGVLIVSKSRGGCS